MAFLRSNGVRFFRRLSILWFASLLLAVAQQQPATTGVEAQTQLLRLSVSDSMDATVPPNIQNSTLR